MDRETQNTKDQNISRRDALMKAGKYAAFTAAASMFLLTPKKAQAWSQRINPDTGGIDRPGGNFGGGSQPGGIVSPFDQPSQKSGSGGLRDSPWK